MGNTLIPMKHKTSQNKLVPVKGDVEHSHIYMPEEPEYYYCKDEVDNLLATKAEAGTFLVHDADEIRHITEEEHQKLKYKQPKEIEHLHDYLYKINYEELNYKRAYEYFKLDTAEVDIGGCTAVRKGNFLGRNFDWIYDDNVSFIVSTSGIGDRPATIGVASSVPGLTSEVMADLPVSDMYELIPFMIKDGINEYGLFIEHNVIPWEDKAGQAPSTTESLPLIEERVELCVSMVLRYVLDHFKNATEAVEFLRDYVKIKTPKRLIDMHYATHLMVGDKDTTYTCEILNSHLDIKEWDKSAIMTNFYINDVNFNDDGSVYTPAEYASDPDCDPVAINHITGFGAGLERFNTVNSQINNIESKQDMLDVMNSVMYTHAYLDPPATRPTWYSEFTDHDAESTLNNLHLLSQIFIIGKGIYENRSRDPESEYYGTWQTTHSSVYDIENCELTVRVQEDTNLYTCKLIVPETKDNKVFDLSEDNTHAQYPSAKAVYDYIHDHEGPIVTINKDGDLLIDDLLTNYEAGLYYSPNWIDVDMTGTRWEDTGIHSFDGIFRLSKDNTYSYIYSISWDVTYIFTKTAKVLFKYGALDGFGLPEADMWGLNGSGTPGQILKRTSEGAAWSPSEAYDDTEIRAQIASTNTELAKLCRDWTLLYTVTEPGNLSVSLDGYDEILIVGNATGIENGGISMNTGEDFISNAFIDGFRSVMAVIEKVSLPNEVDGYRFTSARYGTNALYMNSGLIVYDRLSTSFSSISTLNFPDTLTEVSYKIYGR